ncbi:hypothetical protein AALA21_00865 [Eggerthellaceae bacterium 3-80]|nr:hypothetical protein D7W09_01450 [bacterium D16-34]
MQVSAKAWERPQARVQKTRYASWSGAAFVVEALILLVFLAACLALFMSMFGSANEIGIANTRQEQALTLAANEAELFAADPTRVYGAHDVSVATGLAGRTSTADSPETEIFTVRCDVTPEAMAAGTLYRALITVVFEGETLYSLQTACYVSNTSAEVDAAQATPGIATTSGSQDAATNESEVA